MKGNVITANFRNGQFVHTDPLWQYDYGQVLRFTGVSLPETFEVHFSNAKEFGQAKTAIGTADGVLIPDEYLISGKPVFAWIFLHVGEDDGETVYMAQIPVRKRSVPSDEPPTPQEQSAITQAIAALNSAVVDVQEAVDAANSARASATSAASSATAAAASEAGVKADADRASNAATAAESAQTAAAAAQAGAETAQTGAESARDEAAQASVAQIAQINATGAAVLESIPAEYTELSDSVSDLKSDTDYNISSLASNVDGSNQKLHFEQGSLSSGSERSSDTRIRTSYLYIGHLQSVKIKPVNGYKIEVCLYDWNKTYKTYMGWIAGERIVNPGNNTYEAYYIRILLCKSDDSAIVPNEANGNIEITTYSNFTNRLERIDVNNYNIDSILALTDGSQQTVSFEQGSISGGNDSTSSIRIRTPLIYIAHLASIKVQALNGYKLEVDIYNADKSYKTYLGWSTQQRILKPGTGTYDGDYLRFILAKSDDSTIVPSDAEGNISVVAYPKLKSAFNLVYKTIGYDFTNLKDYSNWQIGSRNSAGEITSLQNRIVSDYKKVKKGSIVFSMWNIDQNYGKYFLDAMIFDNNFNLISDSGWTRQVYTIPEDGFLSLLVKKLDDSNIIESEIEGIVDDVFFTENPKNIDKWDFDDGSTIKAINHRGWHEAPENTLPAYIQSHEHGFRYVETDVRFTNDGIPVCLHDATLNRTCRYVDGSTLTQTIYISDITYADSQEYDAGIWKSASYAGTKIPSLFDFLLLCKRLNLLPYIDMGATPRMTEQNLQAIINTVSKCGMTGKVTYLAPDLEIAIMITQFQENARVCTINSLNPVYINYYKALMTGYNQVFANTYYPELIADRLENCRALGIPVETWTVNDTAIIDGLDAYISGVTSDSINVNRYWENTLINH